MPNTESRRAAIYARFSSDKQRVESIEDQVRVCRAYAEGHGMEVVAVYSDEAMSGTSDHRPEFLRMMDDAKDGAWDTVLVYKFDRFSRDRYDSAIYKHRLKLCGVRVVSATEWVPETPEGVLMESILEGYAEFYSRQLAQNVRRGMDGNARKCRTNGVMVYGYRTAPDGTYAIDDAQAAIVREVFGRYLGGETLASILRDLQRRGVTTTRGKRPSRTWIDIMIHSRHYIGEYSWGGTVVPGGMPAIIDEATFEAAQRKGRGRHSADLPSVHPFPLTGRLVDSDTGKAWCGSSGTSATGRTYWYYELALPSGTVRVRQERMEAACAAAVRNALEDAGRLRQAAELASREAQDTSRIEAARQELRDIERRQKNIMRAIEDGISPDGIQERIDELRARKKALESEASRSGGFDVSQAMRALSQLDTLSADSEICQMAVARAVTVRSESAVVVMLPGEGPDALTRSERPDGGTEVRIDAAPGAPWNEGSALPEGRALFLCHAISRGAGARSRRLPQT